MKAPPPPKPGSATKPMPSSPEGANRSPRPSDAKPPATASKPPDAPTPTSAPPTSSTRRPTSTTRPRSQQAGPSPPASSKAPVATSSRTAWTSPAPAGAATAPKRSSSCEPSTATTTSPTTGATTSPKNTNAFISHATPTAPPQKRRDAPSEEPHPIDLLHEGLIKGIHLQADLHRCETLTVDRRCGSVKTQPATPARRPATRPGQPFR